MKILSSMKPVSGAKKFGDHCSRGYPKGVLLRRISLVVQKVDICLQCRRPKFNPWVEKMPWRREWLHTPIFLPGEFHGQRSPEGYSPWGCKESDTTEQLTLFFLRFNFSFKLHSNPIRQVFLSPKKRA